MLSRTSGVFIFTNMQSVQLVVVMSRNFWKLEVVVGREMRQNSLVYFECSNGREIQTESSLLLQELLEGYKGVAIGGLRDISVFFENTCRRLLRERMHRELETLANTVERLEKQQRTKGQKAAIRCLRDVMLEKQEETMRSIQTIQTRSEVQL